MWEVKLQHWENTPRNQVEDQQTQPTYYPTSKNQTWVTLVEGRHTHRCTSPLSTVLTRLHSHRLLNSIKICVFLGTAFSPLASYLIYLFFLLQASKKLVAMLDTMNSWIDEIPPTDQPQRFGNKAFRTWCSRLEEVRDNITELYVL